MSWKTIINFPNYEISHKGKLKNVTSGKIIKGSKNQEGYIRVTLTNDLIKRSFYLHRLVAYCFCDNPNNLPEVHHLNNIRHDNRSCNLKWVTHEENMKYVHDKNFKWLNPLPAKQIENIMDNIVINNVDYPF